MSKGNKKNVVFPKLARFWLSKANHSQAGLSVLESLIAMVVLSIAFLGMSALIVNTAYFRMLNNIKDQSRKLSQAKVSQLSHVDFSLLGTGTNDEEDWLLGKNNGEITVRGPLNEKGELDEGSQTGPIIFLQSFMI